jgi:hypothetical protein
MLLSFEGLILISATPPSILFFASARTLFRHPRPNTVHGGPSPGGGGGEGSSPRRLVIRGCDGYPRSASRPGHRRLLIGQSCGASATPSASSSAAISFFPCARTPFVFPCDSRPFDKSCALDAKALTLFPPCRVHAAPAILARPKTCLQTAARRPLVCVVGLRCVVTLPRCPSSCAAASARFAAPSASGADSDPTPASHGLTTPPTYQIIQHSHRALVACAAVAMHDFSRRNRACVDRRVAPFFPDRIARWEIRAPRDSPLATLRGFTPAKPYSLLGRLLETDDNARRR